MRFELWYWPKDTMLSRFETEAAALAGVRKYLSDHDGLGYINDIGLVTVGGPVLTYPLEGAPLLAKAFGLEEG